MCQFDMRIKMRLQSQEDRRRHPEGEAGGREEGGQRSILISTCYRNQEKIPEER